LGKKEVAATYIPVIKDMYEGVKTSVRTPTGDTEYFPIDIGLHQGSSLSPFLFTIVMNELTREIQDKIPWCMLFADDIIHIDETKDGLKDKLEQWQSLESRRFRLSRLKTEYLKWGFSGGGEDEGEITMDGAVIPRVQKFKYLGSIMEENGDLDDDINYRIRVGLQK